MHRPSCRRIRSKRLLSVTVLALLTCGAVGSMAAAPSGGSLRNVGGESEPRSAFVTACGMGLCLGGSPYRIKGATSYGQYGTPRTAISAALAGNINTLELVEFDTQHHQLSDTESAATWRRVDRFVAAVRARHLHVILNLSEFGQSLQAAGLTMSSPAWQSSWNQYLSFVANRVNAVTGIAYKDDPTIAMVELWGEIPAPGYSNPVGTSGQVETFYGDTLAAWTSLAPNILASSGGFSYLNDPRSGIPWQSVMSDPRNAACDIEINSAPDRDTTVRLVTDYCRSHGKPWFLSAWSSCNKASLGDQDLRDWSAGDDRPSTDARMAAHALDMYRIAGGGTPATYRSAGTDFWNLGAATSNTCELGPQFPRTWHVIRTH